MASKVFISWGGELSKKLAEELKSWLPNVLQFVRPYFTPTDVEKGTRWESDIANELSESNVGIICLTKDNTERPWILFEAGALSKNMENANVCPILFNFDSSDIKGPLTCFQTTKFEKNDFKKLIKTINNTGGESKLEEHTLNAVFDKWWPELEEKIHAVLKEETEVEHVVERTERDLLEEILELTRMNAMRPPRRTDGIHYSLERLLETIDRIQFKMIEEGDKDCAMYFEDMYPAIHMLCVELGRPAWFEKFMRNRARLRR